MNRREAVSRVALLLGGTIVGAEFFLSGCKPERKYATTTDFATDDVAYLDEIADTIIPTTTSPGAKAAMVGTFMTVMVKDCYEDKDQKIFIDGMKKLNDVSKQKYGKEFVDATPEQRKELLVALDKEAKDYNKNKKEGDPNHYFSLMKQLTLLGYFTSQVGCEQALRYKAVPGSYQGCIPYKKGDKAWAT